MNDDIAEIGAARENAYLSGVRDGRKLERERIAARAEALATVAALADEWEAHARLFVAPVDLPVRQDWEFIVRSLRAAIARTEPS